MLDPTTLPLHDIHLPAPISWWPLAPGWWILAGGVLTTLLATAGWCWWWRRTRLRRHARQRLAEIEVAFAAHADHHRLASELSILCRQVALQRFGAEEAAALIGDAWLARLDTTSSAHFFSTGPGQILIAAPYDRAATAFDAAALLAGCEQWLRHLPTSPRVSSGV